MQVVTGVPFRMSPDPFRVLALGIVAAGGMTQCHAKALNP